MEVAYEETHKALSILSFYSKAALVAGVVSYSAPLGQENAETYRCVLADGDQNIICPAGGVDPSCEPWIISEAHLQFMRANGFDVLRALNEYEPKSEFQKNLMDALMLYARHTRAKNLSDKLMFIFTALDSFLLQDANESIQQSIAQRIAYTVSDQPEERMSIADKVVKVYGLRSKFIHHAEQVDDYDLVQDFLLIVWRFFLLMIGQSGKYKTKGDFALEVRRKTFSGS